MLDPIEKLRRLVTLGMWCGCEECHQTLENGISAIHAKGYAEAADALEHLTLENRVLRDRDGELLAEIKEHTEENAKQHAAIVELNTTIAALRAAMGYTHCPHCSAQIYGAVIPPPSDIGPPPTPKASGMEKEDADIVLSWDAIDAANTSLENEATQQALTPSPMRSEPVPAGEGWQFVRSEGIKSLWENESGQQEWFLHADTCPKCGRDGWLRKARCECDTPSPQGNERKPNALSDGAYGSWFEGDFKGSDDPGGKSYYIPTPKASLGEEDGTGTNHSAVGPDDSYVRDPILIREVAGKGRGMFAARDFAAGEIVEACPVIPFVPGQPMPEELADMPFDWTDGRKCILLGHFQLANHADDPNTAFDYDEPNLSVIVTARKHIKAGEEITYHYGVPLWFTPKALEGKE